MRPPLTPPPPQPDGRRERAALSSGGNARAGRSTMTAAVWVGALLGVAIGCRLPASYHARHLTGTCDGACTHYLDCKRSSDPAAHAACAQDCEQVFQDPESIRAFESLECPDTIEYVEGESGRGPGTMIGSPRAR